jgi:hypothetical protein
MFEWLSIQFVCIVLIVVLLIIALSNYEMSRVINKSVTSTNIPRDYARVLVDGHKHPIYIYNSKHTHKRDIAIPDKSEYKIVHIPEHLSVKIDNTLQNLWSYLPFNPCRLIDAPINNLFNVLVGASDLTNKINPLAVVDNKNNIKALIHRDDRIGVIRDTDKVYLLMR